MLERLFPHSDLAGPYKGFHRRTDSIVTTASPPQLSGVAWIADGYYAFYLSGQDHEKPALRNSEIELPNFGAEKMCGEN